MTALILLRDWQASQVEFWRRTRFQGYDVSSFGRARSFWVKVAQKGQSKGFRTVLMDTAHILNPPRDGSGYPYLNIKNHLGHRTCPKVHRLVALAFIPNPDNLPEVNHKTGIKDDPRLGNLEWSTRINNMRHAAAVGLRDGIFATGERHHASRISDAQALEMYRLFNHEGIQVAQLMVMFNATRGNVYDIVCAKRGRGKRLKEKHYGSTGQHAPRGV